MCRAARAAFARGWHAESCHLQRGHRGLSRRPPAGGTARQSLLRRAGRTARAARQSRVERRPDHAEQSLPGAEVGVYRDPPISSFARSTSPRRRMASFTSPTCIAASSRRGTGCARAATCAKWSSNTATIKWVSRGRIWRLVHDTSKPGPQPAMFSETPAQLVAHLEHPNGWWRDTAQKLLVLQAGSAPSSPRSPRWRAPIRITSPACMRSGRWKASAPPMPALVREKLKDTHPQVRAAAIRVSESLFKKGDTSLQPEIQAMSKDKDADVVLQSALTAKLLNWPAAMETLTQLASASTAGRRPRDQRSHRPSAAPPGRRRTPSPPPRRSSSPPARIFSIRSAPPATAPDARGLPMVGRPARHPPRALAGGFRHDSRSEARPHPRAAARHDRRHRRQKVRRPDDPDGDE